MNLPTKLGELTEVRGALTADRRGQIRSSVKELPNSGDQAAAAAVAVSELETAGTTLGFAALQRLEVKGPRRTALTAVRPDLLLLVDVDPVKRLSRVLETLDAWQKGTAEAPPVLTQRPSGFTGVLPAVEPPPAPPRAGAAPAPPAPAAAHRRSLGLAAARPGAQPPDPRRRLPAGHRRRRRRPAQGPWQRAARRRPAAGVDAAAARGDRQHHGRRPHGRRPVPGRAGRARRSPTGRSAGWPTTGRPAPPCRAAAPRRPATTSATRWPSPASSTSRRAASASCWPPSCWPAAAI